MAEANVLEGCELVEAGDAKRCTERERRPFRPLRGIEARRKLAAELDQDIHEKASRRPDEYDVAGIRKCWDPTPFHQSRIPAAMVGMKMGTKDIINLFRHNTGCCQSIQKSADVAAMPVRKVLAGLIVANATIDKNGVVPGTNQIALNGENNAAGSRGYRPRCEPMEMWLIASSVLSGNYSDGVRRAHTSPKFWLPRHLQFGIHPSMRSFLSSRIYSQCRQLRKINGGLWRRRAHLPQRTISEIYGRSNDAAMPISFVRCPGRKLSVLEATLLAEI